MYNITELKQKKRRSIMVRDKYVDFDRNGMSRTDSPETAFLIAHDRNVMVDGLPIPFNPETWTKDYKKIIWDSGTVVQSTGYGSVSEQVLQTLDTMGLDVYSPSMIIDWDKAMNKRIHELARKPLHPDAVTVAYGLPDSYRYIKTAMRFGYTMFENTALPENWVKWCNEMNGMILPSSSQVDIFRDNGVKVPMIVFPHGVNQELYHYVERPKRDTYTFMMFAAPISERKGGELLYKAFKAAFPHETDVRLLIKTTMPVWLWGGLDDPRVTINKTSVAGHEMLNILKQADCMVFPTHGEGFGLPPLQAMATGLPTIVTGWSGCTEYAKPEYSYPIDYDIVDSPHWKTGGKWAQPNFEHLVELMRWCYTNREKAIDKGREAAQYVKDQWTWERVCGDFVSNLDTLVKNLK